MSFCEDRPVKNYAVLSAVLLGATVMPEVASKAATTTTTFQVSIQIGQACQIISAPNMLVVHPSIPVKTVKELIAFTRARPGQLNYASAGHGTNPHLSMELFLSMTGLKVVHIPYKGLAPGMSKGVPSWKTPVARRSANLLCWARSRSISSAATPQG